MYALITRHRSPHPVGLHMHSTSLTACVRNHRDDRWGVHPLSIQRSGAAYCGYIFPRTPLPAPAVLSLLIHVLSTTFVRAITPSCHGRRMSQLKLETVALREKQELNSKWGQILQTAKTEQVDLKARSAALRGRCAVLKDRRARLEQEVSRSRAQLCTGDGR